MIGVDGTRFRSLFFSFEDMFAQYRTTNLKLSVGISFVRFLILTSIIGSFTYL